ncbi:hypothetical protein REPUB_Repub12eG0065900 [Reevesia pubescens]
MRQKVFKFNGVWLLDLRLKVNFSRIISRSTYWRKVQPDPLKSKEKIYFSLIPRLTLTFQLTQFHSFYIGSIIQPCDLNNLQKECKDKGFSDVTVKKISASSLSVVPDSFPSSLSSPSPTIHLPSTSKKPFKSKPNLRGRSLYDIEEAIIAKISQNKKGRKRKNRLPKPSSGSSGKVSNASLTDGNFKRATKKVLNKTIETWEPGKKLGFSVAFDEDCVVQKLVEIEKKDLAQETMLESIPLGKISRLWRDNNFEWVFALFGNSGGLLVIWDKGCFCGDDLIVKERYVALKGTWIHDALGLWRCSS